MKTAAVSLANLQKNTRPEQTCNTMQLKVTTIMYDFSIISYNNAQLQIVLGIKSYN